MKYYSYVEPIYVNRRTVPVYVWLSEEDIFGDYFEHYVTSMSQVGKVDQINYKDCLEGWIAVHWAK